MICSRKVLGKIYKNRYFDADFLGSTEKCKYVKHKNILVFTFVTLGFTGIVVEMRLTTKFLPKGAVSILLRYILNSSFLTGLVNLNLIYLPV